MMAVLAHPATKPRYATTELAAEYAGCSPKTIRRRVADGTITGYRFGRLLRVDLNEIDGAMRPIPTASRKS